MMLCGAMAMAIVACMMSAMSEAKSLNVVPKFCGPLECPPFSTDKTTAEYEIRTYDPTNWAMTNTTNITKSGIRMSFSKLYGYMNGKNENGQRIRMTVPVVRAIPLNLLKPDPVKQTEGSPVFGIMFFIPKVLQQFQTPLPTDPEVYIVDVPQKSYYIRKFETNKMATKADLVRELEHLQNSINDPKLYNDTIVYRAGYRSPWSAGKRHNEIWLEKQ